MNRKPTPPGEILIEEYLKPLAMTQKDLADYIDCDYKVINRIANEKSAVTPEVALKFAAAFDTTPDFWLNAQMAVDLWVLRRKKPKIRSLLRHKRKLSSRRASIGRS